MVFNASVNNISAILWRLVLLVEETGVPGSVFRLVNFLYYRRKLNHMFMAKVLLTWH
jgi:hypothetical protein